MTLDRLEAELGALRGMLSELGEDADPIMRFNLSSRADELENTIKAMRVEHHFVPNAVLSFFGDPVLGSRGVDLLFSAKAVSEVQHLIWALSDAEDDKQKKKTALRVVGVNRGSFGFVLEQSSPQGHLGTSVLESSLSDAMTLLKAARADDESFDEALASISNRTRTRLEAFLAVLEKHNAGVKFTLLNESVELSSGNARQALVHKSTTVIEEEEKVLSGVLEGAMPTEGRFELRLGTGVLLTGSVVPSARAAVGENYGQQISAKLVERSVKAKSGKVSRKLTLLEVLG